MPGKMETTFDRDALARGYARRHLETDSGVEEIHYLPTGAPPREIRFLEVNRLISGTTPLEPIDFGVDIGRPRRPHPECSRCDPDSMGSGPEGATAPSDRVDA
jgi:hypothetical protein